MCRGSRESAVLRVACRDPEPTKNEQTKPSSPSWERRDLRLPERSKSNIERESEHQKTWREDTPNPIVIMEILAGQKHAREDADLLLEFTRSFSGSSNPPQNATRPSISLYAAFPPPETQTINFETTFVAVPLYPQFLEPKPTVIGNSNATTTGRIYDFSMHIANDPLQMRAQGQSHVEMPEPKYVRAERAYQSQIHSSFAPQAEINHLRVSESARKRQAMYPAQAPTKKKSRDLDSGARKEDRGEKSKNGASRSTPMSRFLAAFPPQDAASDPLTLNPQSQTASALHHWTQMGFFVGLDPQIADDSANDSASASEAESLLDTQPMYTANATQEKPKTPKGAKSRRSVASSSTAKKKRRKKTAYAFDPNTSICQWKYDGEERRDAAGNPYPAVSDLRIFQVVCTTSVGIGSVNLPDLALFLSKLDLTKVDGIMTVAYRDLIVGREGFEPPRKYFGDQIQIQLRRPGGPDAAVKIFKNLTLQITGCQSLQGPGEVIRSIVGILRECQALHPEIFSMNQGTEFTESESLISIASLKCKFSLGYVSLRYRVDLAKLVALLTPRMLAGEILDVTPPKTTGGKGGYRGCGVTLTSGYATVFSSGEISVMHASSAELAKELYAYLSKLFYENFEMLRVPSTEKEDTDAKKKKKLKKYMVELVGPSDDLI